jgi:nitrogen fixation protein FixH
VARNWSVVHEIPMTCWHMSNLIVLFFSRSGTRNMLEAGVAVARSWTAA